MAIENLQPLTYVIISIAFAIGISSTFLRLYCRFSLLEAFGVDDVVAIFLLVGRQQLFTAVVCAGCLTCC